MQHVSCRRAMSLSLSLVARYTRSTCTPVWSGLLSCLQPARRLVLSLLLTWAIHQSLIFFAEADKYANLLVASSRHTRAVASTLIDEL